MKIRKAEEKDIPRIMELLGQVLQIHAEIRPDVFIPGTTKYTDSELKELLEQEDKPIYVAAGEDDVCILACAEWGLPSPLYFRMTA